MSRTAISLVTLLLLHALPARAHYLWIEPTPSGLVLRFGEYQENLRESAATRLGEIPGPRAQLEAATGWAPAPLERADDGFAFGTPGAAATAVESEVAVRDLTKNGLGVVKPMFYARLAASSARPQPSLTLDFVPIAAGRVRLTLHGQPLANASVSLYDPERVVTTLTSDAAGEIAIAPDKPGLYVLDAVHVEAKPGSFGGVSYEAVRHRATLTLPGTSTPVGR